MADTRKVHALDDSDNPTGPLLCGKDAGEVLGPAGLTKGDLLCRKCAMALMARGNEYAETIDNLYSRVSEGQRLLVKQRLKTRKAEKVALALMSRLLDEDGEL